MSNTKNDEKRCGFVAVLGIPNAGKSTLVNALVGSKVSIVSPKVQTTRMRVRGIVIKDNAEIILVDTPGVFRPKRRFDRAMLAAAWSEAGDADLILFVVDAFKGLDDGTKALVDEVKKQGKSAVLVLNKIDLVPKEKLLELTQKFAEFGIFTDFFMVSAEKGECVDDLRDFLAARMPAGDWLFPDDVLSDLPVRDLAAEITREKIFLYLQQELPYASSVETVGWEERADGSVKIDQNVYVQRVGQRKIILGTKGSLLKKIGTAARKELELMLERKVHLFINVKVDEKWDDNPNRYKPLGLDFNV